MAADTEALFRLQLRELEHGRSALDDLDFAYQFQLAEALEASRALASEASPLYSHADPLRSMSDTEARPEPDEDVQQRREFMEAQAGLGYHTDGKIRTLPLPNPRRALRPCRPGSSHLLCRAAPTLALQLKSLTTLRGWLSYSSTTLRSHSGSTASQIQSGIG